MTLGQVYRMAILPSIGILPAMLYANDTHAQAVCQLLATGLQESGLTARTQKGGPAHSLLQFEPNGVRAVLTNRKTATMASNLCDAREVLPVTQAVYTAIINDDVLAFGFGRLLLWADPHALPVLGDVDGAWQTYLRCWGPGQPRPDAWAENYAQALTFVQGLKT